MRPVLGHALAAALPVAVRFHLDPLTIEAMALLGPRGASAFSRDLGGGGALLVTSGATA